MPHIPFPLPWKQFTACSSAGEEAEYACCLCFYLLAVKETFLWTQIAGWKAMARSLARPMSRNTSSNKDPHSETSQPLISQEFLKSIPGSFFRSQAIFCFTAVLEQAVGTRSLQMSTGSFTEQCYVLHSAIACWKPGERREHNQDDLLLLTSTRCWAIAETGCRARRPLVWPSWQVLCVHSFLHETLPHQYTDLFIPRDDIQRAKTQLWTKAIEQANTQDAFSPVFGGNPVTWRTIIKI